MAKGNTKSGTEDWRNLNTTWEEKMTHIHRCNYGSDITIKICEDKSESSFKAHRFVLSMSSEVFDAMLKAPIFKNPGEAVLMLMNVHAPSFALFLEFLYCKTVQFNTIKDAIGVFKIAEKFNITELKNLCTEYVDQNFNIDNVMETVEFAEMYKLEGLKQRCFDVIQKETAKVLNEANIHSWKIEWLMLILDQPVLSISEPELFRIINKWLNTCNAENECAKSKGQACLIPKFRFMNFKPEEFVAGPVKSGLLSKHQCLAVLGHIVADEDCHLDYPECFNKNLRQNTSCDEKNEGNGHSKGKGRDYDHESPTSKSTKLDKKETSDATLDTQRSERSQKSPRVKSPKLIIKKETSDATLETQKSEKSHKSKSKKVKMHVLQGLISRTPPPIQAPLSAESVTGTPSMYRMNKRGSKPSPTIGVQQVNSVVPPYIADLVHDTSRSASHKTVNDREK